MTGITGEWYAEQLSEYARENERPWIKDANGCWIALACGETQAESITNAQAISLLPELIEALGAVLLASGQIEDYGFQDEDDPYARARSILARLGGVL